MKYDQSYSVHIKFPFGDGSSSNKVIAVTGRWIIKTLDNNSQLMLVECVTLEDQYWFDKFGDIYADANDGSVVYSAKHNGYLYTRFLEETVINIVKSVTITPEPTDNVSNLTYL